MDECSAIWDTLGTLSLKCTLWSFNIAVENQHFSGKWQFSIVMLVYERVPGGSAPPNVKFVGCEPQSWLQHVYNYSITTKVAKVNNYVVYSLVN